MKNIIEFNFNIRPVIKIENKGNIALGMLIAILSFIVILVIIFVNFM